MRTPLYLVALIVAIANTPLDIYKICAWNHGTARVEPWRRKLPTAVVARVRALATRFRDWCRVSGGLPAVLAVASCLLLCAVLAAHGHDGSVWAAVPVLSGLKGFRQRAADLKTEIATLTKERADIGNKALAEKRALTDPEREQFVALGPQIDALQAQLGENDLLLQAAEAANEAERVVQAGRIRPDADAEAARRAADAGGIRTDRIEVPPASKMGLFGRQLQAVRNVAIRQASADDMAVLKPMMPPPLVGGPTGMNTDVPSDGGFLVVPERSNTIIQRMYDTGLIMNQVFRMPIGPGANGMKLPAIDETSRADNSRYGGIISGWLGQGNTLSSGKPKFREMDLKLRKVGAFVYATDEQLADSVALEAWISKYLPLELTFRTEDAVVNGDGSNKPAGILNSGAAVTVTRNTANRVLYEDVSGMWKRMWAPLRSTAAWLVDQSVEQDLEQISIAIGTSGVLAPIYKPAGVAVGPNGTQGYSPATLYGRPILTTEYGANLGTVGDIILVNLGEYTVIDKGAVDQAVSLHVAFLSDEAVYRFMYRVDGQLNWNAPLTPKSGGSTLSPVVTLT